MADEMPQAGTTTTSTITLDAGSQTPPVTDGSTPASPATPPESVDALPSWAQKMIADLRGEAATNRKKVQEERKQAEEKRLADQQQWEQLATQRAAEIAALSEQNTRLQALADRIRSEIDAEAKAWPAEIAALRPATDDPAQLLEYREKARVLVGKLSAAANPAPGNGKAPTPAGQGRADMDKARKDFERAIRSF